MENPKKLKVKTQNWSWLENPTKSDLKKFNPSREKHGKTQEGLSPTLDELISLEGKIQFIPIEKSKRMSVTHIGMDMSDSQPQRFKIREGTKSWYQSRKETEILVKPFKLSLPYWGESLYLKQLEMEIFPAGRK